MANRELKNVTETIGTLEADYRMLLDRSIDAIVVVDQNRIMRFVNPAAETILGGKAEELLGESFPFPLETNEVTDFAITHSDGEPAMAEMRVIEIEWQGEDAYLVSLRDVTEYRRTEEAFRTSEGRYKALTDNLNIGLYRNTPGPRGRFIEVNPAHFKMFGYGSKEEFLAVDIADLYQNPGDREKFSEKLSRLGSVKEELRLKKKDGTPFIGLVSAVAVKDENGRALYFDGIIENITKRKRAETLLQESEKKYRLLIENSNAAISMINSDGVFILLNKVAAANMDGKPDDFIGKSLYDIFPEDVADGPMETIREVVRSGKGQTSEGLIKLPIGERWISANVQPVIEPDGGISSVQIISQDVTRYKKIEEMLRQREEALRQSSEREDQAFAQGRLEIVDTILHNIGNAMNSVTIGTDTIQSLVMDKLTPYLSSLADAVKEHQDDFGDYVENDPQGQKVAPFIIALADEFGGSNGKLVEAVDRVAERVERVADIIRTVKYVSGRPYRKNINLKEAVNTAITVLRDSIESRDIEIRPNCDKAPDEISTQGSLFHQMLVNLVKNSVEAIDDLRELEGINKTHFIEIICYAEAGSLILEVTDNGIGIEKEMLEVIFRPGYTTKKSGTGFGLHSIANFVKGCDGQIQALSDGLGKGATMRIVLPLSEE